MIVGFNFTSLHNNTCERCIANFTNKLKIFVKVLDILFFCVRSHLRIIADPNEFTSCLVDELMLYIFNSEDFRVWARNTGDNLPVIANFIHSKCCWEVKGTFRGGSQVFKIHEACR